MISIVLKLKFELWDPFTLEIITNEYLKTQMLQFTGHLHIVVWVGLHGCQSADRKRTMRESCFQRVLYMALNRRKQQKNHMKKR